MAKAVSLSMLILFLVMYIAKFEDVSRIMMAIFYLLNIGLLALSKGTAYKLLKHYRSQGYNFRNVLIVGSKERARDAIDMIGEYLNAGFKVLGCLDVKDTKVGQSVKNGVNIIGTIKQLKEILTHNVVDELIFAIPLRMIPAIEKHISMAEHMGISVRIIPDWQLHYLLYRPGVAKIEFEEFLGLPTMTLKTTPPNQGELLVKTAFDYIFAFFALVIMLPVFIIICILIKLSSKGPVFFIQERLGLNGRRFNVFKFRTMAADAAGQFQEVRALNEVDGPVFKIKNDPRVIPYIGKFLRRTGLDELPQLINVLRGEMSIVGPRPPIPSEVKKYNIWQRRRLSMKPGITCLWQITPCRNTVCFDDWMKMDLEYIDKWSLWLDLRILFKTAGVVLAGSGC
jgi:exopolysaccharide biosynthesis polyprenyl glycosylphosphotransferase